MVNEINHLVDSFAGINKYIFTGERDYRALCDFETIRNIRSIFANHSVNLIPIITKIKVECKVS